MLREILGDPDLELRFWLPESEIYVDARGRTTSGRLDDARVSTPVTRAGAPLGLVVHRPVDDERPGMLEQSVEAAGLAIEIVRLRVELRRQLEEVEESRARIVSAGYAERRRIERDLHDGAQQRLVSVGLAMRHAQHELAEGSNGVPTEILDDAVAELTEAIEELRELARGVRPAQLDAGLVPALRELAARSPVPVELETGDERFPADLEAAAYFIASEGLTNAVKHARATLVTLRAERGDGNLVISVRDDGIGGAAPADGSGLRGLADRVESPPRDAAARERRRARYDDRRGASLRVVIAEDQVLLREGLGRLFEDAGHEVVASLGDAQRLVPTVIGYRPDLLVVDVRMPPTFTDEGARAAVQVKEVRPDVGVLVLSQHVETQHAVELVRLGGFGYLLKDRVLEVGEFLDAAERVANGGSALDPKIVASLVSPAGRDGRLAELSDREREVLELMAEGLTNAAIGRRLYLSERTVEAHVRHVLMKLDIPQSEDAHRRVLAVLAHLDAAQDQR